MKNMQPRIWNKITGEIAMIDVIDWKDEYVIVSQDYIWNEDLKTGEGECQVYFKDLELMWPTGLLDKNGVEIFEGDIIGIEKMVGEITMGWGDDAEGYADSYGWCLGSRVISYSEMFKRAEVIGNIHENPELLKEDKS